MASKDPSLISDPEEQKWVVEITEILSHQLEINFETPSVSLFQVPNTITTNKPEAYEPQQIGLGPIHHLRPQPYKKMEQKKLAVMRKVLQDYELIKDYKLTLIDKVEQLVPIVRSCYDMFLQGEDKSLAWVFAIDGLFLLNLFHTYNSPMKKEMEEYLRLLKEKAYEIKQKIREENSRVAIIKPISENNIEVKVNSEDETEGIMEYSDDFLHPRLRQKEIVVTEENHTEWEEALGLPNHQRKLPKVGLKKRLMAQDVLMVENQIPFMVLKEINGALQARSGNSSGSTHEFSPCVFQTFCKIHSPLELCSNDQAPRSVDHLLHYMYYSIVNNFVQEPGDQNVDGSHKKAKPKPVGPSRGHQKSSYYGMAMSPVENLYNFAINIPQKEIVQAYEQTISVLETFSQNKIIIQSASKLHDKSGFQFYSLVKHKGIQNTGIHGKDIYLPSVTLNNDSEVILRNLVAYETITANSDSFLLTEYMGLMCALIKTVDDVKLLKKRDIIKGDLGEDEIAQLFIGMNSSIPTLKKKGKSKLRETIDEINKVYESGLRMKIHLVLKKLARYLLVGLKAIGGFVEVSWKIVAFMVSIVALFLLTSQAYCNSYGCGETTTTLSTYASS